MTEPSVLIVGLDPDRVDFSGSGYGSATGGGSPMVKAALTDSRRALEERGYAVDLCMITPDRTAPDELRRLLDARPYRYVVFGAGLRLNPVHTDLFTHLIGIVRRSAQDAALCFNAGAHDTADCVLRLVDQAGNVDQ